MAASNKKTRVMSALLMFSIEFRPTAAYTAGLTEVRQSAIGRFARPGPLSRRGAFTRPKGAYEMRGQVHGPAKGSKYIYAATDKLSFAMLAHGATSPFANISPTLPDHTQAAVDWIVKMGADLPAWRLEQTAMLRRVTWQTRY